MVTKKKKWAGTDKEVPLLEKPEPAPAKPGPKVLTAEEKGEYSRQQSQEFVKKGGIIGGNVQASAELKNEALRNDPSRDYVRKNPNGTITYRPAGGQEQTLSREAYIALDQRINAERRAAQNAQMQEQAWANEAIMKQRKEEVQAKALQNPETAAAVEQAGVLTPEQQAAQPLEIPQEGKAGQILQTALEYSAIAGGSTGAALFLPSLATGVPTGGLSVAAAGVATGVAAAGGFIAGAIKGAFAAYKREARTNVDRVEQNVDNAAYNMRQAILTANKGGDEGVTTAQFNAAYAELLRAQSDYKELEKTQGFEWETKILNKQVDLENFLTYSYPSYLERYKIALMKPDPNYVDFGLDSEGVPI